MKMPSVMSHNFSVVPQANIPRSSFDRSHGYKTTFNSDYLIPIYLDEALPGDTFNCKMTGFARMATPKFPIMDNLYMDTFFFAVPYRLVWEHWEQFNGGASRSGDISSADYLLPTVKMDATDGAETGSLHDYFAIPPGVKGLQVNSLFHRAYNLIWNEWFRDENLQPDLAKVPLDDGPDDLNDFKLLKRGKRHDYFTSCLPWPQKGNTVTIPLAGMAPVSGISKKTQSFSNVNVSGFDSTGASVVYPFSSEISPSGSDYGHFSVKGSAKAGGYPEIFADLSHATFSTINQLREAFQLQKMLETDARGGTRYTEILRAHFGVISPDARLQRPEYLGGGSTPVSINPVVQTSDSTKDSPQGKLAAYSTTHLSGHGFVKSFTEHTLLIGLVSVRADLTYQQGLNRMFSRSTRYDFYWPSFAHLGEQAVLLKEIYAQGNEDDEKVFGYQERYAEYRYKPSVITGKLRSTTSTSLDVWHLSQHFATEPTLSSDFIEENVPMNRILAVPSEPDFIFDSYFYLKCARPMPVYSVPGFTGHF